MAFTPIRKMYNRLFINTINSKLIRQPGPPVSFFVQKKANSANALKSVYLQNVTFGYELSTMIYEQSSHIAKYSLIFAHQ